MPPVAITPAGQSLAGALLALTRDDRDIIAEEARALAGNDSDLAPVWSALAILIDHASAADEQRLLVEALTPNITGPELTATAIAIRARHLTNAVAAYTPPGRLSLAEAIVNVCRYTDDPRRAGLWRSLAELVLEIDR